MTWNLFIDDERNLEDVTWAPWQVREKYRTEEWEIARSYRDFKLLVFSKGSLPSYISFDHDLGTNFGTGFDIAKKFVSFILDEGYEFPKNFDFYVHSQNPIGKANIEGLLNNYLKHKEK